MTDANGTYRIVDLRPGTYTLVFSLAGVKAARFEAVELRADFTGTFNANLEVGALEESITVTGASPVVDVSSNAKVEVLTREVLDQVPTGRNIQAYAQLVSGVSLNVPDVGGSRGMQQTYMSTRGLTSANNIVTVDGLMVNGLDGDGAVQQYFNQAMVQETSYQTSGAGADVSPGGVRMLLATMVADTAPTDLRGTAYGLFNLASGLAMLGASVVAGLLWDHLGSSFTFSAGTLFWLVAFIGIALSPATHAQQTGSPGGHPGTK